MVTTSTGSPSSPSPKRRTCSGHSTRSEQRDIIDALIGLIQRENIRLLGIRTDSVVAALARARDLPGRPIPDALIVASSVAADAIPLVTFDRAQARYGVETREP